MKTITLINGYDRTKNPVKLNFHNPVDVAEMIAHCDSHRHIWFHAMDGKARQCMEYDQQFVIGFQEQNTLISLIKRGMVNVTLTAEGNAALHADYHEIERTE